VFVDDFATISAGSGVHQFCRIGRHAFIGGYSVVTKDALPYAKTVGNRARIYGLNTLGLMRRGFTPEVVGKLKRAYRYLLTSRPEHDARPAEDRAGHHAGVPGGAVPCRLHPQLTARPAAAAADAANGGSGRR
jgi:acyl-[acyl carrier protein]--UDP-N-acetylglucosamine O-acyltransferase